MKRALISLSDKTGAVSFAKGLEALGFEIVSTGGTLAVLKEAGVSVVPIDDVTGFPECLGGRVKTLHPLVHGGILGIRDNKEHLEQMRDLGISEIEVVAVNLYPFRETVRSGASFSDVIENIDIGGPSMVRSAAKNHKFVSVITDADDYPRVLQMLERGEKDEEGRRQAERLRFELATKAFEHTASYDAMIAHYLRTRLAGASAEATCDQSRAMPVGHSAGSFPESLVATGETAPRAPKTLTLTFEKSYDLRYGENPHQSAAYYTEPFSEEGLYRQLHGKTMSYNNTADLTAAVEGVMPLRVPACFAVKHAMPCGAAEGSSAADAYEKTYRCDPLSIFGGIVAFNAPVTKEAAERMSEIFLEVIAAPAFEQEAIDILTKKKNLRLIVFETGRRSDLAYRSFQKARGGILYQDFDEVIDLSQAECVTRRQPTDAERKDMEFAMKICASAKSNAIVAAKDGATIGIGQGQVSRVFAAKQAVGNAESMNNAGASSDHNADSNFVSDSAPRTCADFGTCRADETCGRSADLPLRGAVIASDAFFPFRDALAACVEAGATAVVQPGGSVHDEDIIAYADECGIAMLFTGRRHFRHGY